MIQADPTLLEQAVVNILENALRLQPRRYRHRGRRL